MSAWWGWIVLGVVYVCLAVAWYMQGRKSR
jgi:hypothetical protein